MFEECLLNQLIPTADFHMECEQALDALYNICSSLSYFTIHPTHLSHAHDAMRLIHETIEIIFWTLETFLIDRPANRFILCRKPEFIIFISSEPNAMPDCSNLSNESIAFDDDCSRATIFAVYDV